MLSLLPSARIGFALAVGLLLAAACAEVFEYPRFSRLALLLSTLTALAAVARNAADRRRAEQAGEEHLRAFFETSAVGMAEADAATGRFVRVNDAFCRTFGLDRDAALGQTFALPLADGEAETGFPAPAARQSRVVELATEDPSIERLYVGGAGNPDDIAAVIERVAPGLPGVDIVPTVIGPVIGVHVGPGAIGICRVRRR